MQRRELLSLGFAIAVFAGLTTSVRAAEPIDLSGKWRGDWVSCKSGHRGPLNATFCKVNDTCYRVTFSGRFWVALPFRFTVPLQVTGEQDGKVILSGAPRLPLFGTFYFEAVASECDFTATYSSRNDNGRFNLSR